MSAYPLLQELQASDLEKLLSLGTDQGVNCYVGLTGTDANIIYLDRVVIAGLWSDEREYRLWVEGDEVRSICAVPDEERDEFEFYELDQDDELHVNSVLQLLAVQKLSEHNTTDAEFQQFFSLVLGVEFDLSIGIPTKIADRWEYLSSAFAEAGQLAQFEWSDWTEAGIESLNALSIIKRAELELIEPDDDQMEDICAADDWESAVFQYLNNQLDEKDLKVFAIGQFFDECQDFLVVPKTELRAMNVMLLANRLGLIIR